MRSAEPDRASHRQRALVLALVLCAACGEEPALLEDELPGAETVAAACPPPPALSEGVFPCSDCHDPEIPVNTRRRPMQTAHQEIVLAHYDQAWCLDCHDTADRDALRLSTGATAPLAQAYRLCAQCHPDAVRAWRGGIHARGAGAPGEPLLCAHCHDAHAPAFQGLRPAAPKAR